MIRLFFAIIVFAAVFTLAWINKEPVTINYLFGTTNPLPLALVLLGAFVLGGILFTAIITPAWVKDKMEIRKLRRALQNMEAQKSGSEEKWQTQNS